MKVLAIIVGIVFPIIILITPVLTLLFGVLYFKSAAKRYRFYPWVINILFAIYLVGLVALAELTGESSVLSMVIMTLEPGMWLASLIGLSAITIVPASIIFILVDLLLRVMSRRKELRFGGAIYGKSRGSFDAIYFVEIISILVIGILSGYTLFISYPAYNIQKVEWDNYSQNSEQEYKGYEKEAELLREFKCNIVPMYSFEDNILKAQKATDRDDVENAVQHIKWSAEKIIKQGQYLETIELTAPKWKDKFQGTINSCKSFKSSLVGTNSQFNKINEYPLDKQREILLRHISILKNAQEEMLKVLSDTNCK